MLRSIQLSFILFIICSIAGGCGSSDKPDLPETLKGHWLIVFPDHKLKSEEEREVYGKYQDSIANLYGLKLISIKDNGEFNEIDSVWKPSARWMIGKNDQLIIQEGGKGFNPFKADFKEYENDTLLLSQYFSLEDEKIKVVWHLKKISDEGEIKNFFSDEANNWRKKPTAPEAEPAIRGRLAAMLRYYSEYLKLVSRESDYFLVPRVPLPFRYYQHAIGLKEEMPAAFINLFYSEEDAGKAYEILGRAIKANKFEWGENFLTEYAFFMKKMSYWMAD